MTKLARIVWIALWLVVPLASLQAADVAGVWKAEFNTAVGIQKYVYTLHVDGNKITGQAVGELMGEKHENPITDGKIEGSTITFIETANFGDEIRVEYTGVLAGDQIRFKRIVGSYGTEELVETRVSSTAPSATGDQESVIPLYPGAAPGSESWTQNEAVSMATWGGHTNVLVRNVVRPTLTIYAPKTNATGTAVIIAPGGGFRFLSWESEGTQVAEWLAKRGITAFVLKYRLVDTGATEEAFQEKLKAMFAGLGATARGGSTNRPADLGIGNIPQLAADDGRQAVKLVRQRAAEWKIAPNRIGIMGFSAGGFVTSDVALHHIAENRPNFVAPIYGPPFGEVTVPEDAAPMFILCADDDPMASTGSARLYQAWHAAKKPVELHIYAAGGHGFGMQKKGIPADHWIERFVEWLDQQGLLCN